MGEGMAAEENATLLSWTSDSSQPLLILFLLIFGIGGKKSRRLCPGLEAFWSILRGGIVRSGWLTLGTTAVVTCTPGFDAAGCVPSGAEYAAPDRQMTSISKAILPTALDKNICIFYPPFKVGFNKQWIFIFSIIA